MPGVTLSAVQFVSESRPTPENRGAAPLQSGCHNMVGLAVRPHLGAIKVLLFAWVCTLGAGAAAGRNWKRGAGAPAAGGLIAGNTTLMQHAAHDICSSSPRSYTSELYTMLYAGCLVPSHPSIPCTEAPFEARIDDVTPTECANIAAAAGQELFSLRRLGATRPPISHQF